MHAAPGKKGRKGKGKKKKGSHPFHVSQKKKGKREGDVRDSRISDTSASSRDFVASLKKELQKKKGKGGPIVPPPKEKGEES